MRVLICHNYYQQPGGEDQVFDAEAALLRKNGHDVLTHSVHNDQIESMGMLKLASSTVWNRSAASEIAELARRHEAQVVHFHNTFPLLSPAVYGAARSTGAAVVQTLHNYRLICPSATLYRDGKPCDRCVGRLPLAGIAHGCYRGSRAATATTAAMLMTHRALGTYSGQVDAFIALTHFARDKFLSADFDPEQIHVKPNFLDPDPGEGAGDGRYALFVGRLAEEKGIVPMLAVWKKIGRALPLKICGDGPLAAQVRDACAADDSIQWLGRRPQPEFLQLMGNAAVLVFPSLWYEGFPRTIVESLARGTPVAASDLGSMRELIVPGRSGVLFKPGDVDDMAAMILAVFGGAAASGRLRRGAREQFLCEYSAARNHRMLFDIYHQAILRREQIDHAEFVAAV
jgi:glycosyltransferase involved in cell wall biosynthesis